MKLEIEAENETGISTWTVRVNSNTKRSWKMKTLQNYLREQ